MQQGLQKCPEPFSLKRDTNSFRSRCIRLIRKCISYLLYDTPGVITRQGILEQLMSWPGHHGNTCPMVVGAH